MGKHHLVIRTKGRCDTANCNFATRDAKKLSIHVKKYGHSIRRNPQVRSTKAS